MRHWRTTGNSNMAIQTGSTYISDSMKEITTIPTANLRFSTTASSQKVSTSANIERQPEIAIWPPKPEVVIPPELQQIASKFQQQVRDFWPWRAQIKCRQVIATRTDNRKWQCGHRNRKYLHLWQIGWQFQQQIWGFRPRLLSTKKLTPDDCDNDRQPEMAI